MCSTTALRASRRRTPRPRCSSSTRPVERRRPDRARPPRRHGPGSPQPRARLPLQRRRTDRPRGARAAGEQRRRARAALPRAARRTSSRRPRPLRGRSAPGRPGTARSLVHARARSDAGRFLRQLLPGYRIDLTVPAESARSTVCANGGAMLVRRERMLELGGFDETFFMDFEDIDLCWRAWLRGWPSVYVPDAFVRHRVGAVTTQAIAPRAGCALAPQPACGSRSSASRPRTRRESCLASWLASRATRPLIGPALRESRASCPRSCLSGGPCALRARSCAGCWRGSLTVSRRSRRASCSPRRSVVLSRESRVDLWRSRGTRGSRPSAARTSRSSPQRRSRRSRSRRRRCCH